MDFPTSDMQAEFFKQADELVQEYLEKGLRRGDVEEALHELIEDMFDCDNEPEPNEE